MVTDDQNWGPNNGRSPGRDRNVDGPRRSSRSRSPGVGRDSERGLVPSGLVFYSFSAHYNCSSGNPGNNLHVSGLSHKVDTRDLEAAFTKIGRVSPTLPVIVLVFMFLVFDI